MNLMKRSVAADETASSAGSTFLPDAASISVHWRNPPGSAAQQRLVSGYV